LFEASEAPQRPFQNVDLLDGNAYLVPEIRLESAEDDDQPRSLVTRV